MCAAWHDGSLLCPSLFLSPSLMYKQKKKKETKKARGKQARKENDLVITSHLDHYVCEEEAHDGSQLRPPFGSFLSSLIVQEKEKGKEGN